METFTSAAEIRATATTHGISLSDRVIEAIQAMETVGADMRALGAAHSTTGKPRVPHTFFTTLLSKGGITPSKVEPLAEAMESYYAAGYTAAN